MDEIPQQVVWPNVENEENYGMLDHYIHGGTYNQKVQEVSTTTPEQELWIQVIWQAVLEAGGEGKAKAPCLDCHDDYFEEHPEKKTVYKVKRRSRSKDKLGQVLSGPVVPHCKPGCPCGHYGITIQQCAINWLHSQGLQDYLDMVGDIEADYLRRLLVEQGCKIAVSKVKTKRGRMVTNDGKIYV